MYFYTDSKGESDRMIQNKIEQANTEEAVEVVLELVMYLNVITFVRYDMTLLTYDMTRYSNINKRKMSCHDKKVITL